jgi:hypothetical protein
MEANIFKSKQAVLEIRAIKNVYNVVYKRLIPKITTTVKKMHTT